MSSLITGALVGLSRLYWSEGRPEPSEDTRESAFSVELSKRHPRVTHQESAAICSRGAYRSESKSHTTPVNHARELNTKQKCEISPTLVDVDEDFQRSEERWWVETWAPDHETGPGRVLQYSGIMPVLASRYRDPDTGIRRTLLKSETFLEKPGTKGASYKVYGCLQFVPQLKEARVIEIGPSALLVYCDILCLCPGHVSIMYRHRAHPYQQCDKIPLTYTSPLSTRTALPTSLSPAPLCGLLWRDGCLISTRAECADIARSALLLEKVWESGRGGLNQCFLCATSGRGAGCCCV
eukprot:469546-Rhodomonas_salina.4